MVSGIAYSRDEAKVTLIGVSDQPGHRRAASSGRFAEANINVDMIVQSVSADGSTTDVTFTVGRHDLERAQALLEAMQPDLGFRRMNAKGDVVKISVIGVGMPFPCGHRPCHVPGAGRARHQHTGDLDLGDQDQHS